jgi:hypothetical protein
VRSIGTQLAAVSDPTNGATLMYYVLQRLSGTFLS